MTRREWIGVAVLTVFAAVFHLVGSREKLPYSPSVDEPRFVVAGAHIAASGDLNPHWFGHPGSTVIYPLAAVFKIAEPWVGVPLSRVEGTYHMDNAAYYRLGRVINLVWALACVGVVYVLAKSVFGVRVAQLASLLSVFPSEWVTRANAVRTDTVNTFFLLLTLLLAVRYLENRRWREQIFAAIALGLGIGSKYSVAFIAPVLVAKDLMTLRARAFGRCLVAGAVTIIVFAFTTPYFFLDSRAAWASLATEARSHHLGADGLTPSGNLYWYLTDAFPKSLGWPLTALAFVAIASAVWRGTRAQRLLAVSVLLYVLATCIHPLHWARWILPALPLALMFACDLIFRAVAKLAPSPRRALALSFLVVAASSAPMLLDAAAAKRKTLQPSTEVAAREWMLANVKSGSRVATDPNAAPLDGSSFEVTVVRVANASLSHYIEKGFDLVVTTDRYEHRYRAESSKYPKEIEFYDALLSQAELLAEFEPQPTRGGDRIRVFALRKP